MDGSLSESEDKETLLSRIEGKEITFRLDREVTQLPIELQDFNARIEGKRRIVVSFRPSDTDVGAIVDAIKKSKYAIVDITTDQSDLEDVFLKLTGKQIRE